MLFNKIENTIASLNIESISTERKETLQPLIDFMVSFVKCALSKRPQVFVNMWIVRGFTFALITQERYTVSYYENFFSVCRYVVMHALKSW